MNYKTIERLQKSNGYWEMQQMINTGQVWHMEGSMGRAAMACLEQGTCMLPLISKRDHYGNYVPHRNELKKGTKGTYQNCLNYWKNHPYE